MIRQGLENEKTKLHGNGVIRKSFGNDWMWKYRIPRSRKKYWTKMNVLVYDPFVSEKQLNEIGAKKVELEENF